VHSRYVETCDIFFCPDCTGSMGADGDHRAIESVGGFIQDMLAAYVQLRIGGEAQ